MDDTRYQAILALGSEFPSILVHFMLPVWRLLSVSVDRFVGTSLEGLVQPGAPSLTWSW
jgi:hypothetical protein